MTLYRGVPLFWTGGHLILCPAIAAFLIWFDTINFEVGVLVEVDV